MAVDAKWITFQGFFLSYGSNRTEILNWGIQTLWGLATKLWVYGTGPLNNKKKRKTGFSTLLKLK